MDTETIEHDLGQSTALAPAAPLAIATPMEMLDRALQSNAPVEVLGKLMDLQERWEKGQARKAFDAAMSDAKAEIKPITKNRSVGFDSKKPGASRTDYRHEDLAEIARTVDPILSKFGLSYRFRTTSNVNEPVTVTCIVSHRLGHSEENTLSAGRDDSGNKNSIQAVGSTITFLQRYTLKAALGLAASNDDDGKAAGGERQRITEEQVANLRSLIKAVGADEKRFLAYIKLESLTDIYADKYADALKTLEAKRPKS